MVNGLAIWHYPHRTILENVKYFIEQGYSSVSMLGTHMYSVVSDTEQGETLAHLIEESGTILSVHSILPLNHDIESVQEYQKKIDAFAKWQNKYGKIHILSFDVCETIRDNVTDYVAYALQKLPNTKIALEDFGLNENELKQIKRFSSNPHFGYLLDIGHVNIRLRGKNSEGLTLFQNSLLECPQTDNPTYDDFLKVFRSKTFPIFEIHLHQNDGVSDTHNFLDNGCIEMKTIARVLKTVQFDGILTIESAPGYRFECKGEAADQGIQESFKLWKNLML